MKAFGWLLCATLLAVTQVHADDQCVQKLGKKTIELGNYGICYLKGYRMRGNGVWAHCRDNKILCYEDNAVADGQPGKPVECIEPQDDSNCFIQK